MGAMGEQFLQTFAIICVLRLWREYTGFQVLCLKAKLTFSDWQEKEQIELGQISALTRTCKLPLLRWFDNNFTMMPFLGGRYFFFVWYSFNIQVHVWVQMSYSSQTIYSSFTTSQSPVMRSTSWAQPTNSLPTQSPANIFFLTPQSWWWARHPVQCTIPWY